MFLILVVAIYLLVGCWLIKTRKKTPYFSSTFYALSVLHCIVSPMTSYFARDNYIVTGWRSLGDDAWLLSRMDGVIIPNLIICSILFFLFYVVETRFMQSDHLALPVNDENLLGLENRRIGSAKVCAGVAIVFVLNYFLFNFGFGITGVETETTFRISGLVYYARLFASPFLVYFICRGARCTTGNYVLLLIMIYLLSVSQASRAIAATCYLMLFLTWGLKSTLKLRLLILVHGFITFGLVTLGRGYIYDGNDLNFVEVLVYPFSYDLGFGPLHWQFFVDAFDSTLLRLGGYHEMYHVNEMANYGINCAGLSNFFTSGRVCDDVGYDVFGLDLGSLKFGMNLTIISQSLLLYFLPASFFAPFVYLGANVLIALVSMRLYSGRTVYHSFLSIFLALNFFLGHFVISMFLLILGLIYTLCVWMRTIFYRSRDAKPTMSTSK